MATRQVLAQLCAAYEAAGGRRVEIESVGGVDAARRVASGEPFDLVLLGSDAIDKLIAAGHLIAGSRVDWVTSPISVAIQSGAPRVDISSSNSLKDSLLKATNIGYSTGPSGVYLAQLFEKLGLAEAMKAKTIIPPPGVAVGSLLARGEVQIGFQQRSELINMEGIEMLGNLPDEIAYITTFSVGVPITAQAVSRNAATQFIEFLNSPQAGPIKLSQGMNPITMQAN